MELPKEGNGLPWPGSVVRNLSADTGDTGLVLGLRGSLAEGNPHGQRNLVYYNL